MSISCKLLNIFVILSAACGLQLSDLHEIYNRSVDEDMRGELVKHIVAERAPALLRSRDLIGLVMLSKCKNRSIQTKVLDMIEELLYTREISRCNIDEVFKGVDEISGSIPKCTGDRDLLRRLLRLIITSLGALFLWTVERGYDVQLQDRIRCSCSKVVTCISAITNNGEDLILGYLLKSTQTFASFLPKSLPCPGSLKLGNWRDALVLKENRDHILNDLNNYSEVQEYACLQGLTNQVF